MTAAAFEVTLAGDDADLLMRLERSASTDALAHIFGAGTSYPSDDVRARWQLVLEDPLVTTLVSRAEAEPMGYASFDEVELRHIGVLPDWFGTGAANALHDEVLARTEGDLRLWVLQGNGRARRFYERHGWRADGRSSPSGFPPYPLQVGYRHDSTRRRRGFCARPATRGR